MSHFARLNSEISVSPQLTPADVKAAHEQGFMLIINNRPEGEADDQPSGDAIAQAASDLGMDYVAIPVTPGTFTDEEIGAMRNALANAAGPALAYCRTGTRAALLWALTEASEGKSLEDITASVENAGYSTAPISGMLDAIDKQPPG